MAMRYTPEDWTQIQGSKVLDAAKGVQDQIKRIQDLGKASAGSPSASGTDLPDWLKLKMQAIDSQYGGGGGGGGGGFYSVPSIQPQLDYLKNFQNLGQANIAGSYANLNDLYAKSTAATEANGTNTTAALQKNFADAESVQNTLRQQTQGANQQQADMGGAAGQWAGQGVKDILAAQIAANQSNLENSKASTMASQQQYAQGMADASRQAHTVSGVDQAAVSSGFNNNIASQISNLQNQYQSELSKANAANASSAASSAKSSANAQSDKMKALSDYLKSQDTDAKKAAAKAAALKDPKKGLQAVITAAQRAGHPELVSDFTKMLGVAQSQSAQGQPILKDPNGSTTDTNNITGYKAISVNAALKQILDGYAQSTAPAPGKVSLTKKVAVPAGKDWLEQSGKIESKSPFGFAKPQPTEKTVFDAMAPVNWLKQVASNTSAQKKQQELLNLYNFYTGQYGG